MIKVYDCFTFLNENDLVEIRLRHLWDQVDRFVIVEGSRTHSNHPKGRNFDSERFSWAKEKISYVWAELPAQDDRWEIERYQRYHILKALEDARSQDLILVSDCDEIPSLYGMDRLRDTPLPFGFQQRVCFWYVNYCDPSLVWIGTVAATIGQFRVYNNPEFYRRNRFGFARIQNGGCHFTYLGGPEKVAFKIGAFAHAEFDTLENKNLETLRTRMAKGLNPLGGPLNGKELPLDDVNFPPYLRENKDRYKELFKPWDSPSIAPVGSRDG